MNLLLDTHTLLWFFQNDPKLSIRAKNAIEDPANRKQVSIVTFWELTIKMSLNKLKLARPLDDFYDFVDSQHAILPLLYPHLVTLKSLPLQHGDPFDRALIAQAISENLTFVSKDSYLNQYAVKSLW